MRSFVKYIGLVVLGLITAVFIYPVVHESGHMLFAIIMGAEIYEVTLFPLPSVLCKVNEINALSISTISLGGIMVPYFLSVTYSKKHFWLWYIWFVFSGICLLSFLLGIYTLFFYQKSNQLLNDDMVMLLNFTSDYQIRYIIVLAILIAIRVIQIIKSNPFKWCVEYLY